jgi:Hus1-like protein
MDLQNLIRALRSAAAADEVHVKLAKKGVPVLTFEIRTHLGPIMQDVPVTVMSAARLAECIEPEVETGVRGFTLPNLTRLYSVVERMKGLGTRLQLVAGIGERFASLAVQMLTDNVSVSTKYEHLPRASMMDANGNMDTDGDTKVGSEGMVDLKNLRCALFGHQIQPKHAICFILRHCVLVHLMGDGRGSVDISYYIPKLFL